MLTQGITHTEKSISQGGLVRNCSAGGSRPDRLRSHMTFFDQSEGREGRRADQEFCAGLEIPVCSVFPEHLQSNSGSGVIVEGLNTCLCIGIYRSVVCVFDCRRTFVNNSTLFCSRRTRASCVSLFFCSSRVLPRCWVSSARSSD